MTHQTFQEQLAAELLGVPLDLSVLDRVYVHVLVANARGEEASKKATKGKKVCTVQKEHSFHVQGMSSASLHDVRQTLP